MLINIITNILKIFCILNNFIDTVVITEGYSHSEVEKSDEFQYHSMKTDIKTLIGGHAIILRSFKDDKRIVNHNHFGGATDIGPIVFLIL